MLAPHRTNGQYIYTKPENAIISSNQLTPLNLEAWSEKFTPRAKSSTLGTTSNPTFSTTSFYMHSMLYLSKLSHMDSIFWGTSEMDREGVLAPFYRGEN